MAERTEQGEIEDQKGPAVEQKAERTEQGETGDPKGPAVEQKAERAGRREIGDLKGLTVEQKAERTEQGEIGDPKVLAIEQKAERTEQRGVGDQKGLTIEQKAERAVKREIGDPKGLAVEQKAERTERREIGNPEGLAVEQKVERSEQGEIGDPKGLAVEQKAKRTEQKEIGDSKGLAVEQKVERTEQGEIGDPKGLVARQKAVIQRLEKKLIGECGNRDDRIAKLEQENARLEQENAKLHGSLKEAVEAQTRQAQSMQEWSKQTQELLDARTARLSGAQTSLSTTNRISEMEVLSIVQSLNENILQLAASLTDAWERLGPSPATGRIEVNLTSQPRHSVLVQLARKRDPTGLTFLLQSHLCYQAVEITSSWVHNREPGELGSVYQHISASGEHRIINTKLYITYVS